MKFYSKIQDMECLSGDTLPAFHVQVEADGLTGCTMQIVLAESHPPGTVVLTKDCTAEAGGFAVQLTSEDTSSLTEGTYIIHFKLVKDGLSYKKLVGRLYVHSVAGGDSNGG